MIGHVSICNGNNKIVTIPLSEHIAFAVVKGTRVTHLLIEMEGYKPLKYANADMPITTPKDSTFGFFNFLTMLKNAGALEMKNDGEKTHLVS